jgi:hypothetical protein
MVLYEKYVLFKIKILSFIQKNYSIADIVLETKISRNTIIKYIQMYTIESINEDKKEILLLMFLSTNFRKYLDKDAIEQLTI